jgi:hypothetical protein
MRDWVHVCVYLILDFQSTSLDLNYMKLRVTVITLKEKDLLDN